VPQFGSWVAETQSELFISPRFPNDYLQIHKIHKLIKLLTQSQDSQAWAVMALPLPGHELVYESE